jgi:hypothetical protein
MPHSLPPLTRRDSHELSGILTLPGIRGELELTVESEQALPAPAQVNALTSFLDAWLRQRNQVEVALFAFYQETARAATDSGPEIPNASGVWDAVEIWRLRLISLRYAPAGAVQLTGKCSWEEEHGLELDFGPDASLLYVGTYDGRGYHPYYRDKEWNFAAVSMKDKPPVR